MSLDILIKKRSYCPKQCYPKEKPKKEDWILHLLKSQKANINMIMAFADVTEHSARQMIVNLRKKGHHISKMDYEYYEYLGYKE